MSDATAWETVRAGLLDGSNNLVPSTMSEKEHEALAALASLQAAYEAMERDLRHMTNLHDWRAKGERDLIQQGVAVAHREARIQELEAALREIAAYQGKVAKPLRHAKIARRALETK